MKQLLILKYLLILGLIAIMALFSVPLMILGRFLQMPFEYLGKFVNNRLKELEEISKDER